MAAYLWGWTKRHAVAIQVLWLFLILDFLLAFVRTCIPGQQQQGTQCTEEGYGIAESFTYRSLSWFEDWVDRHEHFFVAASTVAIALFTLTLWLSTRSVLRLARNEFLSTHRPKIILREAFTNELKENELVKITIVLTNVGDSTGYIIGKSYEVTERSGEDPPPIKTTLTDNPNTDDRTELVVGQSVSFSVEQGLGTKWNSAQFKANWFPTANGDGLWRRARSIFLAGYFFYEDGLGTIRKTAFLRVLHPERERFYRIENEPDLDYSD